MVKKKKGYGLWVGLIVIIAIVLIISLSGPAEAETVKIGVSVPLSGEIASMGQAVVGGMQLAVNEVNAKEGIHGKRVELIVEDDKCSADSVSVFNKLINIDQVMGILGPTCSGAAGPGFPIAQQNKVPTVSGSASAPGLTAMGDYLFRVYPSDGLQGVYAANYFLNEMELREIAILYTKNDFGEGIRNVFVDEFTNAGGEVVYESGLLTESSDFKTEIIKVKESGAELVYLAAVTSQGITLMKNIKEANLEIPAVGVDYFSADEFLSSDYSEGALYILSDVGISEEYKSRIKNLEEFKDAPLNVLGPYGYDAAMVLMEAMEKSENLQPEEIKEALKETKYSGYTGDSIEFNEVGDLKNSNFAVFEVLDGKSEKYIK